MVFRLKISHVSAHFVFVANVQTGYCPAETEAGQYGLGSCYVIVQDYVQQAEAGVQCAEFARTGRNLATRAYLVNINSDIEEDFLYNFLLNLSLPGG